MGLWGEEAGVSLAEAAAAAVFIAANILLAAKYDDIVGDALRRQRDVATRTVQMARELHEHYTSVQYNHLIRAINESLNVEIPTYSPGSLTSAWYSYSNTAFNAASASTTRSMRRYNIPNWPICDKEMQLARSSAAADGAMSRMRHFDRRIVDANLLKAEVVRNAYRASTEDAGPVFGLMENVMKIYGDIGAAAISGFNGAMSTIGMGMDVFHTMYGGTK